MSTSQRHDGLDPKTRADPKNEGTVQGEGDYVAGRRFQDAERSFARSGEVEPKAREAEQALDGPEGADLERARKVAADAKTGKQAAANDDAAAAKNDARLDASLKQTFPASDAVSPYRGAD